MARERQRICKDCGSGDVIHKNTRETNIDIVDVMLCSTCLTTRAQLQTMKEDKLPFDKLLAKIRRETDRRVGSESSHHSPLDRLWSYRGHTQPHTYMTDISQYWIEQLHQQ